MIKSMKIRLFPTKEQEILMFKTIGCCRFTYNWALNRCNELYNQGIKYSISDIRKDFTKLKKEADYIWLNKVSNTSMVEAMRNLDRAFKDFFKKKSNYPIFKSRKKSRQSFYVRYDALAFEKNLCNIQKIGKVRFKTNYKIPTCSYSNPYCSYDGLYWYLSFGVEQNENQVELNKDLSIGIDLGIKDLAIVSHIDKPIKNINKTKKVKSLKKRLRRLQRQVSRKYEVNKVGAKYYKTQNIIKLERKIKLIHRKLANIRNNHLHQATNKVVKLRPYRVVVENLNVKGMMKNKHLAKAIAEQKFYEFIRQMEYKCKFNGIEFIKADSWYPSSKNCSACGNYKQDLKLKDRVYKCNCCGFICDRDKNASYNLSNYKLA
ncbi:MAG: RNA-guided endonuclease InsQ/TnpB family protein [Sarcina sp.]